MSQPPNIRRKHIRRDLGLVGFGQAARRSRAYTFCSWRPLSHSNFSFNPLFDFASGGQVVRTRSHRHLLPRSIRSPNPVTQKFWQAKPMSRTTPLGGRDLSFASGPMANVRARLLLCPHIVGFVSTLGLVLTHAERTWELVKAIWAHVVAAHCNSVSASSCWM